VTRAAAPVLAWAAFLTLLAAGLLVWTPGAELQWGPLAGAAGLTWLVGLALLLRGRGEVQRLVPARSYGTLVAALGVGAICSGAVLGLWFALVGCGLVLLGLAAVLRERPRRGS
jgi:hypothetical protein